MKASYISLLFLGISGANFFAILGSICVTMYYLSMLKSKVVNKDFNGSWCAYFKSWKFWKKNKH